MLKSIADRLVEAFAKCMHERVRTDLWGYVRNETLSNEELIAEKYLGIRPAPDYPACPDHTVQKPMFDVLHCHDLYIPVPEPLARLPA